VGLAISTAVLGFVAWDEAKHVENAEKGYAAATAQVQAMTTELETAKAYEATCRAKLAAMEAESVLPPPGGGS